MPDEYISRKAALTALQDSDLFNTTERQLRAIRELPAADVAEVVRCKDCIYRIEGRCFSRTSFINAPAVEPDNFCSWGATE
jgi:hypothetical protein|nr:MAG TPA: hypothetical protein [Caudoviricetes sp.]